MHHYNYVLSFQIALQLLVLLVIITINVMVHIYTKLYTKCLWHAHRGIEVHLMHAFIMLLVYVGWCLHVVTSTIETQQMHGSEGSLQLYSWKNLSNYYLFVYLCCIVIY